MKPERPIKGRLARNFAYAKKIGLPHPLGRAFYAESRRLNASEWDYEAVIRRCKSETAERWEKHFDAGGSVKSLSYSDEAWKQKSIEQRERYRKRREERMSEADRLRLQIRRARRAPKEGIREAQD